MDAVLYNNVQKLGLMQARNRSRWLESFRPASSVGNYCESQLTVASPALEITGSKGAKPATLIRDAF